MKGKSECHVYSKKGKINHDLIAWECVDKCIFAKSIGKNRVICSNNKISGFDYCNDNCNIKELYK